MVKKSENIGVLPSEHTFFGFDPDISDLEFNILRPKDEVLLYTVEITDKDFIQFLWFLLCQSVIFIAWYLVLGAKKKEHKVPVRSQKGSGTE